MPSSISPISVRGKRAGTIPFFRVYADNGSGLKLMKVPGVGTNLSAIVAQEAATKLRAKKTYSRVVVTLLEE